MITTASSLFLLFTLLLGQNSSSPQFKRITDDELSRSIISAANCEDQEHALYFDGIVHANFTHDGRDNVIVVAGTCNTGTAGPDVHSVFSRDSDGELIELPIELNEVERPGGPRILFGNSNYRLFGEGETLVKDFYDTSDRKHPLVIRYKWDGSKFHMISRVQAKPFKTSYDCAKAVTEVEQAICASEEVAKFDVELSLTYKQTLSHLAGDKASDLRQAQREWMKKRDTSCDIYKWWVECLRDLYTARIEEIKKYGGEGGIRTPDTR